MTQHHNDIQMNDLLSPGRNIEVYEALSEAQALLGQGLCVYDAHSRKILYASEGFSKSFGYTTHEAYRLSSVLLLVAAEYRAEIETLMSVQISQTHSARSLETLALRKNGETFATRVCVAAIEQQGPQLLVLFCDLAAERRLQERIAQLESELRTLRAAAPSLSSGHHTV